MRKAAVILTFAMAVALCGCGKEKTGRTQENMEAVTTAARLPEEKTALQTAAAAETENKTAAGKNADEEKDMEKNADEEKDMEKNADKMTDTEMDTDTKKDTELPEEPVLPSYMVAAYEKEKIMFASHPVNVRKGPSTDFEKVGGLSRGQEVTVTGQADTDWYEVIYGKEKAYVSDHYLQEDKPAEEPEVRLKPQPGTDAGQPQQTPEPPVQAVTEVKNVAGVILVGDSRFVQMQENVDGNSCTWIAENGKGYNWFNENAVARIDGCVGKGSKILINLGVNDPGSLKNYLELVNAKAAEWTGKGAAVYYASVNPVWENPYVTEEQVEYFNSQMQSGLSADVHWIDSHSYLGSIGYKLVDGLHYNAETYQNLYAYFMSCL